MLFYFYYTLYFYVKSVTCTLWGKIRAERAVLCHDLKMCILFTLFEHFFYFVKSFIPLWHPHFSFFHIWHAIHTIQMQKKKNKPFRPQYVELNHNILETVLTSPKFSKFNITDTPKWMKTFYRLTSCFPQTQSTATWKRSLLSCHYRNSIFQYRIPHIPRFFQYSPFSNYSNFPIHADVFTSSRSTLPNRFKQFRFQNASLVDNILGTE